MDVDFNHGINILFQIEEKNNTKYYTIFMQNKNLVCTYVAGKVKARIEFNNTGNLNSDELRSALRLRVFTGEHRLVWLTVACVLIRASRKIWRCIHCHWSPHWNDCGLFIFRSTPRNYCAIEVKSIIKVQVAYLWSTNKIIIEWLSAYVVSTKW